MITRSCPQNTNLSQGHIVVLAEVLKGGVLATDQQMFHVTDKPTDCNCSPMRLNGHAPRVLPFMGQRKGHVEDVDLPKGTVRLKLVDILEIVEEDEHETAGS